MEEKTHNDPISEEKIPADAAGGEMDATRAEADAIQGDAEAARGDAEGAQIDADAARVDADAVQSAADGAEDDADGAGDDAMEPQQGSGYRVGTMYRRWFVDYASYVILERAVPHIADGLKPVQRRILHSMKRMDDGKYQKVANIVGHTMQFHPHGDASIGDALVGLGQKDLLIDTQGNWGNPLTGDSAAAPRYIEARLSKFALDVVFNPKTTQWKYSYDGRNLEPTALPVKFPLLLAQGAEGIAVGLSAKILPHNVGELLDAAIHAAKGEEFTLYPDFPTGGSIDVSSYRDGQRGGSVKVRAKIEKRSQTELVITEIPYSTTTGSLCESITKVAEKGKIKIRRVDDNTAQQAEIVVHLQPGTSSDKAIDALYALTDCEISISPLMCVIEDKRPKFLSVSEVLRRSVEGTRRLLELELRIRRDELLEALHAMSLEQIFIEERIYKDRKFENADSREAALRHIDERLEPFKPSFVRDVTEDDLQRLLEIKMARILRYNKDAAEEKIARTKEEIERTERDLGRMTEVVVNWYGWLREKYGERFPRRTEIRSLERIDQNRVIETTERLYINRAEGFIGTALKKDEFLFNCSPLDDILIIYRDGTYRLVRVGEKTYVGETSRSTAERSKKGAEILSVTLYRRGDSRTVYNMIYRDGKDNACYIKRFAVTALTRDREYDATMGNPGSRIEYLSVNTNGEAEVVRVVFRPVARLKRASMTKDFGEVLIKSRSARGNLLTRLPVKEIRLEREGVSTLGGRKVWFDNDVSRLNYDGRGTYLGEFAPTDRILVVLRNGVYYTTDFSDTNHYEPSADILRILRYRPDAVWTAVLLDADQQNFPYLKRFNLPQAQQTKPGNLLGQNPQSRLLHLTDHSAPVLRLTFGGLDDYREPLEVQAADFVGVKSVTAKGKRLTTWSLDQVLDITPEEAETESPTDETESPAEEPESLLDATAAEDTSHAVQIEWNLDGEA